MARYRVVAARSRVWIDARSSLHPIHTQTTGLEGWLDLEVDDSGRVDLRSIPRGHLALPVDRLRSGNPLEDRELRRRIDARRYPTIAGDLTAMEDADIDGQYVVAGDITFRGVTRRYRDTMTVSRLDAVTVRLSGQSTFDVRDFGLDPPRILMMKMEPDVAVRIEIIAAAE
jgi:polyisoprenoid-binding protein YceI